MKKKVCVIPGDDAIPEAVKPTVEILEGMNLVEFLKIPGGDDSIQRYGQAQISLPEEVKKAIDEANCTLFGSTGGKNFSRAALAYLRWGKNCGCHIRPFKYIKGAKRVLSNPEGIDWIMVREGQESIYCQIEGELKDLAPLAEMLTDRFGKPLNWRAEGVFSIRIATVERARKIARFGCELARKRKAKGYPGKVAVGEKWNVLLRTGELFRRIVEETVKDEYPDLTFEQYIIDDFNRRVVERPQNFDVAILPNDWGDIVSDAASATIGGLGLGYSGCYADDYAYFEPIAGSFPRAKGLNIINPTAMLLCAVLMLKYLEFEKEADHLEKAIEGVYEEGKVTRDQGGTASTTEFCESVKSKL